MAFRDTILSERMPEGTFLIPDNVFRSSRRGTVGKPLNVPTFPYVRQGWIFSNGYGVDTQQ